MSKTLEYRRRQEKRTNVAGARATVPMSNDHTDGTWLPTDIYEGELFINMVDQKVFTRKGNAIITLAISGSILRDDLVGPDTTWSSQYIKSLTDGKISKMMTSGTGGKIPLTNPDGSLYESSFSVDNSSSTPSSSNITVPVSSVVKNGDAAALAAAMAYTDAATLAIYKPVGDFDASSNTFPTAGSGTSGAIKRGDTYNISVPGTPTGFVALDKGDAIYANKANPGQNPLNWSKFEANTEQATQVLRGTAKFAADSEYSNSGSLNITDMVNVKGLFMTLDTMALVRKALASEVGVVNPQYMLGDVRRYGVFPDGVTNWEANQGAKIANIMNNGKNGIVIRWVTDFSQPNGGNLYFTSLNFGSYYSGIRMIIEKGVEFGGTFHLISGNPAFTDAHLTNVMIQGDVICYDRFGLQFADDIFVDGYVVCKSNPAKNSATGTKGRGAHLASFSNFKCKGVIVEDCVASTVANGGAYNTNAAVAIDGGGNNPKGLICDFVWVKKSDCHGIYVTGSEHNVIEFRVDEYGATADTLSLQLEDSDSLAQTQEIKGVWINRCWDSYFSKIKTSQGTGTRTYAKMDVLIDEIGISTVTNSNMKEVIIDEITATNVSVQGVNFGDRNFLSPNCNLRVGYVEAQLKTGVTLTANYGLINNNGATANSNVVIDHIVTPNVVSGNTCVYTALGSETTVRTLTADNHDERVLYALGKVNIDRIKGRNASGSKTNAVIEFVSPGSDGSTIKEWSLTSNSSVNTPAFIATNSQRVSILKSYTLNYRNSTAAIQFTGCNECLFNDFHIEGIAAAGNGLLVKNDTKTMFSNGYITNFAIGVTKGGGGGTLLTDCHFMNVKSVGNTVNGDIPDSFCQFTNSTGISVGGASNIMAFMLQLKAGAAAALGAGLKWISGPLNTAPEVGADQFLNDKRYITITTGAAVKEYTLNDAPLTPNGIPKATTNGRLINSVILNVLAGSASLSWTSIGGGGQQARTISVPGAVPGDVANLGVPVASGTPNVSFSAEVRANDVVTVIATNAGLTAQTPGSGTFKTIVIQQ